MVCGSGLSALTMVAGAGLLGGVGLGLPGPLGSALSSFSALNPIAGIQSVIGNPINTIGGGLLDGLTSLGSGIFASLGDAIGINLAGTLGSAIGAVTGITGLAGGISGLANGILGSDLGVFAQHLAGAAGFATSANEILGGVMSAGLDTISGTFGGFLGQLTGGLSNINLALPDFAADLVDIGSVINFSDLGNFGNPLSLVKNFSGLAGGLPIIGDAIEAVGLSSGSVLNVLNSVDNVGSLLNASIDNVLGSTGIVGDIVGAVASGGDILSSVAGGAIGGVVDAVAGADSIIGDVAGIAGSTLVGGLGAGATEFFKTAGINPSAAGSFGKVINTALNNVTGDKLAEVQNIMGSGIRNLDNMGQMLNPEKLFQASGDALTSFTGVQSGVANNLQDVIQQQKNQSSSILEPIWV